MNSWNLTRSSASADFVDRLERRGFVVEKLNGYITGRIQVSTRSHPIRIQVGEAFPFAPPRVHPVDEIPRSWHRELDGALCLYGEGDRDGLPWLDVDDFLTLISRWFDQTATAWKGDSPDLDLERYFPRTDDDRLVLYAEIHPLIGAYICLVSKPHTIEVVGLGSVPRAQFHKNRIFGFVLNIGEPQVPPTSWEQLAGLVDPETAGRVAKAIYERRITMVLVRYVRRGREAVVALNTTPTRASILVRSYISAPCDQASLTVRAGAQADRMATRKVCLVGVGAVGSFTADALVRAGIGHLTLRDGDVIRPGNLVRHLAGVQQVGMNKADAVTAVLRAHSFANCDVQSAPTALDSPSELSDLLLRFDLLVDATADACVTEMLTAAAKTLNKRFISVCLKNEGSTVRVDIIPPLAGHPLPDTSTPNYVGVQETVYEGGCGSPVSLTPPYAVIQAASLAARHAIGLLEDVATNHPAGEVSDYSGAANV